MQLLITLFLGFLLLSIQAVALFFLVRWYKTPIRISGLLLLGLIVLTLSGGFLGGILWWFDFETSFAWDTPPLASRMLAAAAWSFALLSFATLQRPTRRRVRLYLWMLAVYMLPLTLVILLFHLDRFDFASPISWDFFIIVLLLDIAVLIFLFRQPQIIPVAPQDQVASNLSIRAWLLLVLVITALWSLALFATDQGPLPAIWAWKGDLLSSRLIGSMLATLAVGALYAFPRRDTALVVLAVTAAYGIGLSIASLWNILADKPVNAAYLFVFGVLGLGSALILLWELARAASQPQPVREPVSQTG